MQAAIAPMADRLAIAAINAPDSVVVSGEAAAVDALLAQFAARNVQGQRLFVSLAAHSPLVEPALDAMEACARKVAMHAPRIPVAWNLSGGAALPGGAHRTPSTGDATCASRCASPTASPRCIATAIGSSSRSARTRR